MPVAAVPFTAVGVKKQVEGQKQCFCVAGKPQIKYRDGNDRQGQDQPDGQMKTEIQHQVNDETDQGAHAIVDGKDGEKEISRLPFERVTATGTAVERHKPISQGSHL